jgi:hypothetical protein
MVSASAAAADMICAVPPFATFALLPNVGMPLFQFDDVFQLPVVPVQSVCARALVAEITRTEHASKSAPRVAPNARLVGRAFARRLQRFVSTDAPAPYANINF